LGLVVRLVLALGQHSG